MTRILLADDHALFRNGLRALLEAEPDLEIVGEASTGHSTVKLVEEQLPDLLIMDLSMPGGMSGPVLAETVLEKVPGLILLILTMHDDEYLLRELLKIGARGFLLKRSSSEQLIQAVRGVLQGEVYVDPSLTQLLVPSFVGRKRPGKGSGRLDVLTKREQEVCRWLALGHTNAEVGSQLFISERTVETHRTNIMSKLELSNRAELVRFAIDHGLLKV
ncbi:MAG: response regulator transcription factor [bacterium]